MFHCSHSLYEVGDRIAAGNWGRVILGRGPEGHKRFYPEYVFERIRQHEFPNKPARMSAAFACPTIEAATVFASGTMNPPGIIYDVRPENPSAAQHEADMTWIETQVMHQFRTFEGVESCARNYWNGVIVTPEKTELVVASALVVVKRVTVIPDNGVIPTLKG